MFIVFNWVFLFESYENTSIAVATVVYHTQPFHVVLLGALLFRERLTAAKVGWIAVAFAGLVLVSGVTPGDFTGGGAYLTGIGQALLAALLYGLSTLVTMGVPPRVEQRGSVTGVRPHLVALVQVLAGIPLLLPFADFGAMAGTGAGWGWLAGLGVLHTGLMYVLVYAAYAKLPTSKIAVLAFVHPAVAMVVDWAVYGHHIGLVQALGVPLIVMASLGVTSARPARPRVSAPAPRTAARAPEAASRPATPVASEAVNGGSQSSRAKEPSTSSAATVTSASSGCRTRAAVVTGAPDAGCPGAATSASGSTAGTSPSSPGCSVSVSIRKPRSYAPCRSACRVSSPIVVRSARRTLG